MPAFPGVDFLDFDSLLNDEELLARKTARQFVDDAGPSHHRKAQPRSHVPDAPGAADWRELGFFGANLKGYGCAGMSNVAYGLVMQELERGDSGLRSFVSVQAALVMYPIHAYGSRRAKRQMAAAPAKRQSHRLLRAHRAAIRLESRRHADARRKQAATATSSTAKKCGSPTARSPTSPLIWAKCEDEKIRGFLVEKGTTGFKAWDVHGKLSLRASVTSGLAMNDCEIPAENVLPGVDGLQGPALLPDAGALRHRLGRDRRGHGLLRHGAAIREDAQAIRNKPIASHQLVQDKLVCMITEITKAQLLALHSGQVERPGPPRSLAHLHAENE